MASLDWLCCCAEEPEKGGATVALISTDHDPCKGDVERH
jgi:hypothetical protein